LVFPLTLTEEEASQYKEETHFTHLGLKPSLDRARKKKPYLILSKTFSKSRRSKTWSYPLSTTHSRDSWAKKLLSMMLFPITNFV
jgi:hypothetical protein